MEKTTNKDRRQWEEMKNPHIDMEKLIPAIFNAIVGDVGKQMPQEYICDGCGKHMFGTKPELIRQGCGIYKRECFCDVCNIH